MSLLFAILFAVGINWIVSIHYAYQASDTIAQRIGAIALALAIGVGLGLLVV